MAKIELHRNSDLVECGVDEYEHLKSAPKKKKAVKKEEKVVEEKDTLNP